MGVDPICEHGGLCSGVGRYGRESKTLIFVLICQGCGAELRKVTEEPYEVTFDPHGNTAYTGR